MKLVKFLMKMKGETVTVELKNGTVAVGSIVGVDIKMNLHLKLVQLSARGKPDLKLENFSIRGNNIRHVVLPDFLPIDALLVEEPRKAAAKGAADGRPKRIKKPKKQGGRR